MKATSIKVFLLAACFLFPFHGIAQSTAADHNNRDASKKVQGDQPEELAAAAERVQKEGTDTELAAPAVKMLNLSNEKGKQAGFRYPDGITKGFVVPAKDPNKIIIMSYDDKSLTLYRTSTNGHLEKAIFIKKKPYSVSEIAVKDAKQDFDKEKEWWKARLAPGTAPISDKVQK